MKTFSRDIQNHLKGSKWSPSAARSKIWRIFEMFSFSFFKFWHFLLLVWVVELDFSIILLMFKNNTVRYHTLSSKNNKFGHLTQKLFNSRTNWTKIRKSRTKFSKNLKSRTLSMPSFPSLI